jgi:hypothetical protein
VQPVGKVIRASCSLIRRLKCWRISSAVSFSFTTYSINRSILAVRPSFPTFTPCSPSFAALCRASIFPLSPIFPDSGTVGGDELFGVP